MQPPSSPPTCAEKPADGTLKSALTPELRRKLNAGLVLRGAHGLACAVLRSPGEDDLHHIIVAKLPRSSSGKAPRRTVQIPLGRIEAVKAQAPRRLTRKRIAKQQREKSRAELMKQGAESFKESVKASVAKTKAAVGETLREMAQGIAALFALARVPVSNVEVHA